MGTEIADRNNPSQQLKVNSDGSIDTNVTNDGQSVSSANPLPVYIGTAVDIQVGAVEIKDGDSGLRADVMTSAGKNGLIVINSPRKDMEYGGKISVGTASIEATFTGTPTHSILITADIDNTDTLYIGTANVSSVNAMTFLEKGDSITIDYDDSDNAVYVVSNAASQNFWKGCLL